MNKSLIALWQTERCDSHTTRESESAWCPGSMQYVTGTPNVFNTKTSQHKLERRKCFHQMLWRVRKSPHCTHSQTPPCWLYTLTQKEALAKIKILTNFCLKKLHLPMLASFVQINLNCSAASQKFLNQSLKMFCHHLFLQIISGLPLVSL
jgi:hypothetical protein